MKILICLSIIACKLTRFGLRLLGRGGTDFPGKVALRLSQDVLSVMAQNVTTVVVTGTNGKTTSSRMLEQCFRAAGLDFFSNKSGANLLSGITTEFAMNSTITGRCRKKYALIECDEAAFRTVSRHLGARCVLVTNVFRDQLDRYGEITHTLESIRIGLKNSPSATICLNADDSLSASLSDTLTQPVVFYGVETEIYHERAAEVSDAPYCIRCKGEYEYDYVTYGHLGGFRCRSCGYSRPAASVAVTAVLATTPDDSRVLIRAGENTVEARINLPGGYNIYNACGTVAAAGVMGIPLETSVQALSDFECGFGRMEKFRIHDVDVRMILVKNPAGCNQVLNFLSNIETPATFIVCLNDRAADGTDISWIWDVDFEKLLDMGDRLARLYVSGVRAYDMALRFQYAGIPMEKINVIQDPIALMETATTQGDPVYIMPTYTAMLDLRDRIAKNYGFKNFWE